jgi:hypothetical protein
MTTSFYFNDSGSGFALLSAGVGAAYLHWFQILVDGQPQSSWPAMMITLKMEGKEKITANRPGPVFASGSQATIFWVAPGALDQQLRERVTRITFKMCYCSIFDDCWLNTCFHAPQEVTTCDPPPKVRYGGFPEPHSQW